MEIEAGPGLTDGMNMIERAVQMMEGFPVKPLHDFVFVADLGQPNLSQGGVWLPDEAFKFGRYKYLNERYGIVCAIGAGRTKWSTMQKKLIVDQALPDLIDGEGLALGTTVMFNRRFGSRLGYMFQPECFSHPLYIRVLDPEKVLCLVEDFEPWWDIERGVLSPDLIMSG